MTRDDFTEVFTDNKAINEFEKKVNKLQKCISSIYGNTDSKWEDDMYRDKLKQFKTNINLIQDMYIYTYIRKPIYSVTAGKSGGKQSKKKSTKKSTKKSAKKSAKKSKKKSTKQSKKQSKKKSTKQSKK